MPHHCSKLKNVFFPETFAILFPEFPSKGSAMFNVLRTDKVDSDLYAIRKIAYLQRGEIEFPIKLC